MFRKFNSPFLPLGLMSFHLIVWRNMQLQRLTYFPSEETLVQGNIEKLFFFFKTLNAHALIIYYLDWHTVLYRTVCCVIDIYQDIQPVWCLKEPNLIILNEHNLITHRLCLSCIFIFISSGLLVLLSNICTETCFIHIQGEKEVITTQVDDCCWFQLDNCKKIDR